MMTTKIEKVPAFIEVEVTECAEESREIEVEVTEPSRGSREIEVEVLDK